MIRSLSFDNILNKKYEYIPFSKDFMDAFGKRQKSGAWIVYGKSGQGKTSFTFQLAREFDRIGYKVLFISLDSILKSLFFGSDHIVCSVLSGSQTQLRAGNEPTRRDACFSKEKKAF